MVVVVAPQAALSRGQYALATGVTLALFLLFYAAFGALLLARRWPPLARRVGSLAVLADNEGEPVERLRAATATYVFDCTALTQLVTSRNF